ncbi:MAG: hypothetical protein J1E00_05480 [Oscillospiraceae bacterium]|nr:hypothetical protein [Oscillospiraceae bacterium]
MQKKHFDPINLTAGILLAVVAVLNSLGVFLLPKMISGGVSPYRVPSLSFLVGGILLVGVSGIMAVFGPKPKKWIAMQAVLTVADVALVLYNLLLQ